MDLASIFTPRLFGRNSGFHTGLFDQNSFHFSHWDFWPKFISLHYHWTPGPMIRSTWKEIWAKLPVTIASIWKKFRAKLPAWFCCHKSFANTTLVATTRASWGVSNRNIIVSDRWLLVLLTLICRFGFDIGSVVKLEKKKEIQIYVYIYI